MLAEIEAGEETQIIAQDIRSEVAKVEDQLPEDAEAPITEEFDANFPLISVGIAGDVPDETLRAYGLKLEDQIKLVDGVDNILTSGMGDPVFWVYVDPEQIRQ
ncbi:MAG: efflux RND transporter permease subunit, partial [Phycisphaerae bacterium]|nr:efflux RND transporter permease subunit [Phycisphaerae bacterium]NIX02108.1 hypothetical protein [Phycisphaerae bacterium]NIX27002.1 hypothetical protein [Phycisphaerae bacterium]